MAIPKDRNLTEAETAPAQTVKPYAMHGLYRRRITGIGQGNTFILRSFSEAGQNSKNSFSESHIFVETQEKRGKMKHLPS